MEVILAKYLLNISAISVASEDFFLSRLGNVSPMAGLKISHEAPPYLVVYITRVTNLVLDVLTFDG